MIVRTQGLDFYVRVDGPAGGPVMVMLHGLGGCGAVWDDQAAAFCDAFRVIRPDLRGHGLSAVAPGTYRVEDLAGDVLAVMDALAVGQAHIIGLGLGGLVAQALAATQPGRVASLILCATAMALPDPASWRERAATARSQGMSVIAERDIVAWAMSHSLDTPAVAGLRTMLLRTAPEGYAAAAEAIATADLTEATSRLRLPALVLAGERDGVTPPALARALQTAIAGSSLEMIPYAAHVPPAEQPEAVTDAIQRFLQPATEAAPLDGMTVRRQVLGDAHVDRAIAGITDFDRDFQAFITSTAWGGVWTRPGLDRRTRSLLTLALMAALGHHEELALHVRASRNTGTTPGDIAEVLIQVAAYAGIPAANSAVRVAKQTLREMETP